MDNQYLHLTRREKIQLYILFVVIACGVIGFFLWVKKLSDDSVRYCEEYICIVNTEEDESSYYDSLPNW